MGKRKVSKPVGRLLRKSGNGHRGQSNIVGRKRARLSTIHEEELAGEMTLLGLIHIQVAYKLIIGVRTGGTESSSSVRALRGRNHELAAWQLRIQHRKCCGRN